MRSLPKSDATEYQPKWIKPISAKFRTNTLWTIPAPASGAIWLSAMGILNQFEAALQGSVLDYHRVTEVLRVSSYNVESWIPERLEPQQLTSVRIRSADRAGRSSFRSRTSREASRMDVTRNMRKSSQTA
jgi:gamma-glutamyltranspeptidase